MATAGFPAQCLAVRLQGKEKAASPLAHRGPGDWQSGSSGRAQASSPSRVLPDMSCSAVCPTHAGRTFLSTAPSPGRTRDGSWALRPWGTGCPVAHLHGVTDSGQQRREEEGRILVQSRAPSRWMEGKSPGLSACQLLLQAHPSS